MIPILYESTETEFTSEGLGRLAECTRCVPVEGVNDIFECEFDYPVTGKLFSEIEVGRIIFATHDDTREPQPFDIYRKSEPIGGVVTFNARHISYRLNEVTVQPFTATSCAAALQGLKTNSVGTNPFTFSTDKNVTSPYEVKTPSSLRGLLGGQENSILDVYGKGEYKFDKWSVQLLTNRGTAKSTSIRYGKNLIDYNNEFDAGDTYNAVYPYWFGSVSEGEGEPQDTLVELPEKYITSGQGVPSGRTVVVPMDLSQDFQEPPTVAELRTLATNRLAGSDAWVPSQTITIDFVALWQTDEYKDFEPVQHVNLCDTISVVMPMYGTSYRTKVIRTEYNTLLDRYDKLELGTKPDNLAGVITASLGQQFSDISTKIQSASVSAQQANNIAGHTTQHFWFTETGTDTGAHITEVTQDEFLADPTQGGGNLLARSNGVAIRKGLTEVATFAQDGVTFADDTESTAQFGSDSARIGKASATNMEFVAEDTEYGSNGSININNGDGVTLASIKGFEATSATPDIADAGFYGLLDVADKYGQGSLEIHGVVGQPTDISLAVAKGVNSNGVALFSDGRITSSRLCTVLWSGSGYLMTADHSISLSDSIDAQMNGIVLVWSRYASQTVYNDSWSYQFVPKWHTLTHNDGGVYFSMPLSNTSATVCNKYLYISEDGIRGHASNNASGTGYNNGARVLRAVLGV